MNEEAVKLGIMIGVENRLRHIRIPFMEEFDIIFNEFAGGAIRYWHDCGHGEIMQRYGFLDHEKDLLAKYADLLAGVHLHDVNGREDHVAPGMGDLDFRMVAKYLKEDTIRILEVHERVGLDDVARGLLLLAEQGIT